MSLVLAVEWVSRKYMIVAFAGHTHLFFVIHQCSTIETFKLDWETLK